MDSQHRVLVIVLALAAALVLFLWLQPKVSDELAPKPVTAWVAVDAEGAGHGVIGPSRVEAGDPFTLYAVLEAERRNGDKVYYTQAKSLTLPGGEAVEPSSLRPWDRARLVKIRWFTVESRRPFVRLPAEADNDLFDSLQFEEVLRGDWSATWSVPGEVRPARGGLGSEVRGLPGFGTQRFHVRVELYASEDSLVPNERFRSWGAEEVATEVEHFPSVVAALPEALAPASQVFGLPQIDLATGLGHEAQIGDWVEQGLAFTRLTVIRDQIASSGRRLEDLDWGLVELTGTDAFGEKVRPGDLLQVGERLVVLYDDRGQIGRLDYDDLCLDFVDGAAVRLLREVFSGEGQTLRHASLH